VALLEGSELRFEVVGFALRVYTRIPILQHPELGEILLVDRAAVKRQTLGTTRRTRRSTTTTPSAVSRRQPSVALANDATTTVPDKPTAIKRVVLPPRGDSCALRHRQSAGATASFGVRTLAEELHFDAL